MRTVVLLLAVLMLGLMAGLFYAYAGSVMPGMRQASDRASVEVMQRINVAIQNPLFLLLFMGSLVVTAVAAAQNLDRSEVFVPLLVALILYAATLAITFAVNIPLNNRLDRATLDDPAATSQDFFPRWIRWNILRTVTNVGAFAAGCWALIEH
jgi:uncharacterized membrane protein